MRNLIDLSGKRILVSGASSGIGRATAVCCAEQGAKVVLVGRRIEKLEETASLMPEDSSFVVVQDLGGDGDYCDLFKSVTGSFGKLDGMVYCAGMPCVMPLKSLSRDRLHEVMNVNFYSYVEMCRQFVKKRYSNDNACVIGISAVLVDIPRPYELGYIASKAAMEAASRVLALEYASRGMRFNCLAPGSVRTEMVERVMQECDNREQMEEAASRSVFGWQEPEQVAEVCAFLLSDSSGIITGKTVKADGGYL